MSRDTIIRLKGAIKIKEHRVYSIHHYAVELVFFIVCKIHEKKWVFVFSANRKNLLLRFPDSPRGCGIGSGNPQGQIGVLGFRKQVSRGKEKEEEKNSFSPKL